MTPLSRGYLVTLETDNEPPIEVGITPSAQEANFLAIIAVAAGDAKGQVGKVVIRCGEEAIAWFSFGKKEES